MQQPHSIPELCELTIQEILARCPAALPVFHAFGMDACCGGVLPLREAAERHAIDLSTLVGALRQVEERR